MPDPSKYVLVSLPTSIVPSHHKDAAFEAVSATITADNGSVSPFPVPEFKIGTLDALVQQADELAKLESACRGVVAKVSDALKNVLDGDETQVDKMKTVNDSKRVHLSLLFGRSKIFDSKIRACRPVPAVFFMEQNQVSLGQVVGGAH